MNQSLKIYEGAGALQLLNDQTFQTGWRDLHTRCPWATAFQSPAFVCTWFASYESRYTPLLVTQDGPEGLCALLTMARSTADGALCAAGAHQAEYQCWIASPENSDHFILSALKDLSRLAPNQTLVFKYLPPGTPSLRSLKNSGLGDRIDIEVNRRPLLRIDPEAISKSMKKKSNKSRLNRIKRLGDLSFERLNNSADLEMVFDEIIAMYDFRQGATNQTFPFLEDELKKDFHLDLMRRSPELLHVTTMRVSDALVSSHIGVTGKDGHELHLAILSTSPLWAKHSPGKFHLMFLGQMLPGDGITCLDLTPGGDAWKERFANEHDETHKLIVYPTSLTKSLHGVHQRVLDLGKRSLGILGISPAQIRALVARAHEMRPANVATRISRVFRSETEVRVYHRGTTMSRELSGDDGIKKDHLPDLLNFEPASSGDSKNEFTSQALSRLETGQHVYTAAQNGILVHCGWMNGQTEEAQFFPEVDQQLDFPAHSAILRDFYARPGESNGLFLENMLTHVLLEFDGREDKRDIFLCVSEHDAATIATIDKLGFEYRLSLFRSCRLGVTRKWSSGSL